MLTVLTVHACMSVCACAVDKSDAVHACVCFPQHAVVQVYLVVIALAEGEEGLPRLKELAAHVCIPVLLQLQPRDDLHIHAARKQLQTFIL